jgi:hypothetical protein
MVYRRRVGGALTGPCLDRLRRTGYAIADDAATPALPWWIYPQYSDALGNRITILQRSPSP